MAEYYKVLTRDLRSPIQRGGPLFDGSALPYTLPAVTLDESNVECGAGWNFCQTPDDALRIAGFWPNGRSSRVFVVDAVDVIQRKDKCRAAQCTITHELGEVEIAEAIARLSLKWFGDGAERMAHEQIAWRYVLGYGYSDPESERIRASAQDARGARRAQDAWGAQGAQDAWDAWGAWGARRVWDVWGTRGVWDARGALAMLYAAIIKNWVPLPKSYKFLPIVGHFRAGR